MDSNVTEVVSHALKVDEVIEASQNLGKYSEIAINIATEYGIKILAAIAIFIIGKMVVKSISRVITRLMEKAEVDATLTSFVSSTVNMLLMIVVILAALSELGVQTTSFIAILGAAGLAIGLALQGTLSNIGAAVLIIIFRPFKIGDFIEAGGATGTVDEINMFSTTISPLDNRLVIVPNAAIIGGNITNYSTKENRRVDLTFGIGYDDDLRLAKSVLMEIITQDPRILKDPEPFVAVSELADSSVNFITRSWVKSDDYWDVYFDLMEQVKLTFDERGISIPYPQMDVHSKAN
ncbi:MAG: mechanosensitive ion channel [Campylobacterota bacterium]|nr:mechanosensitive ion channel [Campylobacterota bacterium]